MTHYNYNFELQCSYSRVTQILVSQQSRPKVDSRKDSKVKFRTFQRMTSPRRQEEEIKKSDKQAGELVNRLFSKWPVFQKKLFHFRCFQFMSFKNNTLKQHNPSLNI